MNTVAITPVTADPSPWELIDQIGILLRKARGICGLMCTSPEMNELERDAAEAALSFLHEAMELSNNLQEAIGSGRRQEANSKGGAA